VRGNRQVRTGVSEKGEEWVHTLMRWVSRGGPWRVGEMEREKEKRTGTEREREEREGEGGGGGERGGGEGSAEAEDPPWWARGAARPGLAAGRDFTGRRIPRFPSPRHTDAVQGPHPAHQHEHQH